MNSKRDESLGIKKYLRYIIQRVAYLKAGVFNCSSNQYRFYLELLNSIKDYSHKHKLYWKFLTNKISFVEIKDYLGEADRQAFRYLERQRTFLIGFILSKEEELFKKYPFEDKAVFEVNRLRRKSNGS